MAKKPVTLNGLLYAERHPTDIGMPQREAGLPLLEEKPKREGERRLTLALDGETFGRSRLHAVETDPRHPALLEQGLESNPDQADA
ncbi:MAG: CopG family transcriptional regulator [Boseongicola sp.]|nr:CopG family transcriptional regulator [Boseongicola sp.]